jgi:hypothetical protein
MGVEPFKELEEEEGSREGIIIRRSTFHMGLKDARSAVCYLSDEWISGKNWAIKLNRVANYVYFTDNDVCRTFLKGVDVKAVLTKKFNQLLEVGKNVREFTRTDWMYRIGQKTNTNPTITYLYQDSEGYSYLFDSGLINFFSQVHSEVLFGSISHHTFFNRERTFMIAPFSFNFAAPVIKQPLKEEVLSVRSLDLSDVITPQQQDLSNGDEKVLPIEEENVPF